MKKAYLWVIIHPLEKNSHTTVSADLVFSSREKFYELGNVYIISGAQLVEIEVPDEFDHWDFIPENY